MQEPIKIVVMLEGGLIQQVMSAGIPVEVVVVDYDTEGADEDTLTSIPGDSDGPAYVSRWTADTDDGARQFVMAAFDAAREED